MKKKDLKLHNFKLTATNYNRIEKMILLQTLRNKIITYRKGESRKEELKQIQKEIKDHF